MTNDSSQRASSTLDPLSFVRSEFRNLSVRELLNRPPRVLLGVTSAAVDVLEKLEIVTLFDLATSGVFDDATKLLRASEDLKSAMYQHGRAPADVVREDQAAARQVAELQFLPVGLLQRIPASLAPDLQVALDVETVRPRERLDESVDPAARGGGIVQRRRNLTHVRLEIVGQVQQTAAFCRQMPEVQGPLLRPAVRWRANREHRTPDDPTLDLRAGVDADRRRRDSRE